jgi:hypothetical protein
MRTPSEVSNMTDNAKRTTATVIPTMRYNDARGAIDWLCQAFGFEKSRYLARTGRLSTRSSSLETA